MLIFWKIVLEMPNGICHEILVNIPIVTLEKTRYYWKAWVWVQKRYKTGLISHYSHKRAIEWNFEVIFTKDSNKDLVSQLSITNQQFLDIKGTTNSEAKLDVKDVGVFKLALLSFSEF